MSYREMEEYMSTETKNRIAVRMDQETSRRLEQWYLADH